MNKGIIIGIVVLVVIGIAFAMMQEPNNETQQVEIIEGDEGEPQRYTVNLSESMGVAEGET